MHFRSSPPNGQNNDDGSKKDVYAIVTERIIAQLEKGTVPWRKPWSDAGIPRNLISKRPYRCINVLLLSMLGYEHNLYLTFNQLEALGGSVRKGERPHLVTFWNYVEVSVKDRTSNQEDRHAKQVAYLRYYLVYNIGQCEGIPQSKIPVRPVPADPIPLCDQIAEQMPQRPPVKHGKEQRAYYDPLHDYVNMPRFNTFVSAESYYSTLMHELVHSTGHHSRLNRKDLLQMEEFNSLQTYSHEELVAEIGSCFLLYHAGVTNQFERSAAYIQGWLQQLRNDRKFIVSASSHAQRAADFILNVPSEVMAEIQTKPDNPVGLYFLEASLLQRNLLLFALVSLVR